MQSHPSFRLTSRAQALALLLGGLAGAGQAAIVTLGEVNPSPAGGTVVSRLSIGLAGSGSVVVDGGSTLSGDAIGLGEQAGGHGAITVTGSGSRLALVPSGSAGNLDIGAQGTGSLSVLAGASFAYGATGSDCSQACRIYVGNAAGSTGQMLVSGSGSTFDTTGQVVVGQASVFTQAIEGYNYGTPGASANGNARVDTGATATASRLVVAAAGTGSGRTGAEQVSGALVIDGIGSAWNLVRQAAQTGAQALLLIASGRNTQGSVSVQNGAHLTLDGAASRNDFTGINVGTGGPTAQGRLVVDGAGSRIDFSNALGFVGVGVNGPGSTGQMDIRNGAVVAGGVDSLPFVTVGRNGATGSLTVSGTDASGNASLLRMTGLNPVTGGGAFLSIGRNDGSGGAGNGSLDVSGGGRVEIDVRALNLANPNGLAGFHVGVGDGAIAALNIAGRNAVTGGASTLSVQGGANGFAPYAGVGADGATGTVNITAGGQLLLDSARTSTGAVNTSGNSLLFDIGRNSLGGTLSSTGVVNVGGAGSLLALSGTADNFIQVGRGDGGNGTLNVSSGAVVQAKALLVGTDAGAIGTLNVNASVLDLQGSFSSGISAGQGGGLAVGRNGGVGTANIGNGSTVNISSTLPFAAFVAGGSKAQPGGTGSINVSGGSTVNVSGPQAVVAAGNQASTTVAGVGTINITGAGTSVQANGVGAAVYAGRNANTSGLISVGAGASLSTNGLVGIAHNGTANTGGTGVLMVDGTLTAASLVNGKAGLIGGNGVINASTINHGVINPGHSPGKLTFNGAFDNSDGKIVLDILMLPDGSFVTDQIVFGDPSQVTMGAGQIEFDFLGTTDPNAFFATGHFQLDSFFKEVDGSGVVQDLPAAHRDWFGQSAFSAWSDSYQFSSFSFDPITGARFSASAVPLPNSAALAVLGLLALLRTRRGAVPSARSA